MDVGGTSCIYRHQRACAHTLNFVADRNVLFDGPRLSEMIFQREILGALDAPPEKNLKEIQPTLDSTIFPATIADVVLFALLGMDEKNYRARNKQKIMSLGDLGNGLRGARHGRSGCPCSCFGR